LPLHFVFEPARRPPPAAELPGGKALKCLNCFIDALALGLELSDHFHQVHGDFSVCSLTFTVAGGEEFFPLRHKKPGD
jgi:hypothetical protein